MSRISWGPVIQRAAAIVKSYSGGVTLRQLFYRLLSEGLIPNTESAYKTLSSKTAAARRAGTFPALVDHTREIWQPVSWASPGDALQSIAKLYRRDRMQGQPYAIYIGAEKATMQSLLRDWFGDLGMPILLLRGYGSQSYLDEIAMHAKTDTRPRICIYAGDLDPSGEDIERDFDERTGGVFDELVRVAVHYEQVAEYGLVKQKGKARDPRAPAFARKYGQLFQVEVEALPPDTLRGLFEREMGKYLDLSMIDEILKLEKTERKELQALAGGLDA